MLKTAVAAFALMTRAQFEGVLERAQELFAPLATSAGERLGVGGFWSDDWVSADSKRWPPHFFVTVYGGLAREPRMTTDALALAVCHELGHGYGGLPYKEAYNRIAAEGQADYWGGGDACAPKLLERLDAPASAPALSDADERFLKGACGGSGSALCERILRAAQALMATLADLHREREPRLSETDPSVVPVTELGHPKTYQCRLDTWVAARFGRPRPKCWFHE